jgi:hypothetical protein
VLDGGDTLALDSSCDKGLLDVVTVTLPAAAELVATLVGLRRSAGVGAVASSAGTVTCELTAPPATVAASAGDWVWL